MLGNIACAVLAAGGEKKRNEILQLACLEADMAILDEIDSGEVFTSAQGWGLLRCSCKGAHACLAPGHPIAGARERMSTPVWADQWQLRTQSCHLRWLLTAQVGGGPTQASTLTPFGMCLKP